MPRTLPWKPQLSLSFTSSETSLRQGESLQNCRLRSCLEIILQTNQKCFLLLSCTEQLFIHKVSVHHIPSCFNNLFHVKLLPPWPPQLPPILITFPYTSLSKMLGMCILMYVFFSPPFTSPSMYIRGEGNYVICLCLVLSDWVLKILFDLVFKTDMIYSLNH